MSTSSSTPRSIASIRPFSSAFAPHYGMFQSHAGADLLDQIRFAHDQGFTAWEDNEAAHRERQTQVAMGDLLASLGMTMGVFVAYADFERPLLSGHRASVAERTRNSEAVKDMLKRTMHSAVDTAKRTGARWATVVPGTVDPSLPLETQTANVAEMLRICAEICEPAGLVLVVEPLNPIDHPGCFLTRLSHAHQLCKLVGSPAVKILDDLYHQQITEGNLLGHLEAAWDEVAYIQVGDVPGRCEPTTGEINYHHVFKWLHRKGYRGIIGMEHNLLHSGPEGEAALLAAYRRVEPKD